MSVVFVYSFYIVCVTSASFTNKTLNRNQSGLTTSPRLWCLDTTRHVVRWRWTSGPFRRDGVSDVSVLSRGLEWELGGSVDNSKRSTSNSSIYLKRDTPRCLLTTCVTSAWALRGCRLTCGSVSWSLPFPKSFREDWDPEVRVSLSSPLPLY